MSSSSSVERRSRPKATLFCPGCDHESHVHGDWVVRTGTRITTECPDCGTRIDERPRRPRSSGDRPPATDPSSAAGVFAPMTALLRLQCYVLGWWSRHARHVSPRLST